MFEDIGEQNIDIKEIIYLKNDKNYLYAKVLYFLKIIMHYQNVMQLLNFLILMKRKKIIYQ